jgi:2-polyprenyl-6-hydroxyphenyl methylase/3-demethylubiquinone-9 3-methyltransferase
MGVDLDDDSVNTTRKVLARYAPDREWTVQSASVFDMTVSHWGLFDVAYSWGVLHHTGDMYRAIRQAAALVRPAGWFVFALYRKTWMCWFWRWEKRWYTNASARARSIANGVYTRLFALGLLLTGRRFKEYVQTYNATRGMDYYHDVHDWLGGYPYESISVQEVDTLMRELGFERRRMLARQGRFLGRDFGLFGSGCDEFVYVRVA